MVVSKSQQSMVGPEFLTNGAEVLSTARLVSMRSRDLCRSSEWLIVAARLLLLHRPWIAGAADDPDEPVLRQRIREFVTSGVLRADEPLRIWAGRSEGGKRCAVCGRPIVRGQIEYEVTSVGSLRLLLDRRCVELWELEVKVARGGLANRQGKALSRNVVGLGAREVRPVEGRTLEANGKSPDPLLRCAICLKDIPEGTGYFRFGESRVHVECRRFLGQGPSEIR